MRYTPCAIAVMRGPAGAVPFITTSEGRSWLPPGVFFPRELSIPWQWDEILGTDSSPTARDEAVDPARILVEFGRSWGSKTGTVTSALASSDTIVPALQAELGSAATEEQVKPAYELDLRVPGPHTTDRLGITGSMDALDHVAALPARQRRARSLQLATRAQQKLFDTGPTPRQAFAAANLRDRILAALEAGQQVPQPWWHELQQADQSIAAALSELRTDSTPAASGVSTKSDRADTLRALTLQRRCTEAVLLLNNKSDWQLLRDEVHAFEQIAEKSDIFNSRAGVSTSSPMPLPQVEVSNVGAGSGIEDISSKPSIRPIVTPSNSNLGRQ